MDLLIFVVPILNMLWVIFLLFISCELGQRVSNEFDEIDDGVSALNWYRFPKNIWRVIPLIMTDTQQAVRINCFGKNITCTREIFQKVSAAQ